MDIAANQGPVLGLETSCDETAAAVVHAGRVLGHAVATQIPIHRRFGGVVPEIAARNHLLTVLPTIEATLAQAGVAPQQLGGIAVTARPGLIGALLVGVQTANALAWAWNKPLVGVDHTAAHVWSAMLRPSGHDGLRWLGPRLPFAALVVSGGHTSLYRVDGPADLVLLGRTLDDAAGEAFDKFGKLLGLSYPAGPEVDRLAAQGKLGGLRLPRAMWGRQDGAYSFSGLKTAARQNVAARLQAGEALTGQVLADLCADFQAAVVEQLVRVTMQTVHRHRLRNLVVAGGVAANAGLRAALDRACAMQRVRLWLVPVAYCGDNGAMVACLGEALLQAGHRDDPFALDAQPTGEVRRATAVVPAEGAR